MSGQAKRSAPWTALIPMGWLLGFLLAPFAIIVAYSLAHRGSYGEVEFRLSFANYLRALDPIYLEIFWRSLGLAVMTSLSCLLIGFPMAYLMATASKRWRSILLVLVVLPFWTNFIVRTYAIKAALADAGPLNAWMMNLGLLKQPFVFNGTLLAVAFGMLTNYLPFMVLPLYVALEKFDFTLIEAAADLGASPFQSFFKVLIPLSLPGVATGLIFVFAPSMGEFVIPDLLGGARTMLLGNLVTEQFLKSRDWPFGSSLAVMMVAAILLSLLMLKAWRGERHMSIK